MAESELLDAREAMQILGINEGDLQTLVARGDLRAFRSAGTPGSCSDEAGMSSLVFVASSVPSAWSTA